MRTRAYIRTVMSDDLPIAGKLTLPGGELTVAYARSGGPGGQRVNKVETKVQLRWSFSDSAVLDDAAKSRLRKANPSRITRNGELMVECSTHASRSRNLTAARARLAELVQACLKRPKRRKPTRPSRGSVERRLKDKKARSQRKANRRNNDY